MKKLFLFLIAYIATAQTGIIQVTLNWDDARNPPGTMYNVKRFSGPCTGTPLYTIIAPKVASLTYVDTTVTIGTYCYVISATNGTVESGNSLPVTAIIPIFTPTNLRRTIP